MSFSDTKIGIYSFVIIFIMLNVDSIYAQIAITAEDSAIVIDFSGFIGEGFSPNPSPGQLNSNYWAGTGMSDGDLNYDSTITSGDWARGIRSNAVGTGGLYAYDNGQGDTLLLIQPGGTDWTPGTLDLRIQNNTGGFATSLRIEYHLMVRNDQNRANSFNFSYSVDSLLYTNITLLNYISPEVSPGDTLIDEGIKTSTIYGVNIADGNIFYFRWYGDDVGGGGSRDEFLLDDIEITINPANQPPESFNLLAPSVGSRFVTSPTSTDTIDLVWTRAIDPEDDEVQYYIQFDTSSIFENEIVVPTETDTLFRGSLRGLDTLLNDLSVAPGDSILMYWCVLAQDSNENITVSADTFTYWAVRDITTSVIKENYVGRRTYTLNQNYPNPFNPSTHIEYTLRENTDVSLVIYNTLGQVVRTLINREKTLGSKEVFWNGRDDFGREVSSGIYIYRLIADDFIKSRKMILIR